MRALSKSLLPLAAVLAAFAAAAPAFSDPAPESRHLVAQQDGPSLSEAVEIVRQRYGGRILSAETHVSGNREVHVIKVLTEDGKVKTERIPGRRLQG